MQVKVLLALVTAALVAGLPEPEPEPEPNVDVVVGPDGFDVEVDSGAKKLNGYLQMVKTAGETSFMLVSKLLGEAMGYKYCKVKVSSWPEVVYKEYPNGAKDVPCGGLLVGKNGTCVDGNVVCEADNVGTGNIGITINIDNGKTNETIYVNNLNSNEMFFGAMQIAQQEAKLSFTYEVNTDYGALITSINGVINNVTTVNDYWIIYKNGGESNTGVSYISLENGDIFTWRYEEY